MLRAYGRGLRKAVLAIALLSLLCAPRMGAAVGPAEADVKAVFVLNFIKFVEWPASAFRSPEDPILLSVVGSDPVGDAIESLSGKTVSGRKLVVRKAPDFGSLKPSHILYIGASEKAEMGPVLVAMKRWPVLTVADFEGFAGRGGTIGFIRLHDRVGFEINEESARNAGLKLSAKLLYLGKSIGGTRGGER
jgi:hypothetical protein